MRIRAVAGVLVLLVLLAACRGVGGDGGPTAPTLGDEPGALPDDQPGALPDDPVLADPDWPLVQVDPAVADLAAALLPPGLAEINVVSPEVWTNHGIPLVGGRPVWYFGTVSAALPVPAMGAGYGVHGTIWPDAPLGVRDAGFVSLGPAALPEPRRFYLRSFKLSDAPPDAVGAWLDSPEGRQALAAVTGPARVSVVGDVMLARGVETRARQHGSLYPWELVRDRLRSADLVIANLEAPIARGGTPLPGKEIWFRADPSHATLDHIDAVTLANNHILDYDTPALLETLDYLQRSSIAGAGAGRNIAEARQPAIVDANGVRLALLSYSEFADLFFSYDYPRSFRATDDVPGVAPLELDVILEDIATARAEADIVLVALHWGVEYMNVPEPWQVEFARRLIDGGADVIVGQHPHAVQGFERYNNGLIFYSFGNFIMDQYDPETLESLIADLWVTPAGIVGADIVPVHIEDFRPVIAAGEQRERLWQRYEAYSARIPQPD